MIGGAQHVEVVLDDDQRVALIDQTVKGADQALDVGEVQAGRRLVEHEEGAAAAAPSELGGELDPLGLATRERVARLPEGEVPEPDLDAARASGRAIGRHGGEDRRAPPRRSSSSTSAMVLPA